MIGVARLTIVTLVLSASAAAAQEAADVLAPIRQLYASADYEEALTELGRMQSDTLATGLEINRYKALCLIALNRGSEADRAIESIVNVDPLYQPSVSEASPRVRAAFDAVRDRMLPGVARALYVDAKAAYDRKAYLDAAATLEQTVRVIDAINPPAKAELADLRVLASGFLDLSKAAVVPPAPAKPDVPSPPPAPAAPTAAAPAPVTALPPNTPLVALKQELPRMPFSVAALGAGEFRGVIELRIDEDGNVTATRMVRSVQVLYDPLLLKAALGWKYQAPRVAGKPVATVKLVEVVVKP